MSKIIVGRVLMVFASRSHIADREVSEQWREAKRLAGLPESVDLFRERHRHGKTLLPSRRMKRK